MTGQPNGEPTPPNSDSPNEETKREAEGLRLLLHYTRRKFENAVIRLAERLRDRGLD